MEPVYVHQPFDKDYRFKLFLAGCTVRDNTFTPWRTEALSILKQMDYRDQVLIPETKDGVWSNRWEDQVEWEEKGLLMSNVVLFWIPRDMKDYYGLTSNCEFGWLMTSKPTQIVLGAPPNAKSLNYLKYHAKKRDIPVSESLKETVRNALIVGKYKDKFHPQAKIWDETKSL